MRALAKRGEVAPGEYIQFDMSDTGKGISRPVLARCRTLFAAKPFGGGSGLGLSMVYGFVRR